MGKIRQEIWPRGNNYATDAMSVQAKWQKHSPSLIVDPSKSVTGLHVD